jgi:beta-glucosidase
LASTTPSNAAAGSSSSAVTIGPTRATGTGASPSGAGVDGPSAWPGSEDVHFEPRDTPTTAMGWAIDPHGLVRTLRMVAENYPVPPLYITENGAAFDDTVGPDGTVEDPDRVDYYATHLRACHEAIRAGVPLRGYFSWSLLDNFEWAYGYDKRFGLVYVDYPTQQRIPKASARFYADVIAHNGLW